MSRLSFERPRPAGGTGGERNVNIIQGEFRVSDDPGIYLSTLLGSCVAACICDRDAGVGGMNHFLLPGQAGSGASRDAERYGVHLMELLLNGLLQKGARRNRLEAKLFGGGKTMAGLVDIGSQNADFAERFLTHEGIAVVGGSLRGNRGRRIQFWPTSGRARQVFMAADKAPPVAFHPVAAPPPPGGDVDFF